MHRAVVSLPDGLMRRCAGCAGELCAAAGLEIKDGAPALPLDPAWDLRAAAATLARTEELGGAADEHGRFPASASSIPAGTAPLDELVLALRDAAAEIGATPAPVYPGGARFAVALTHDIDTPWRWSRRGLLGAGGASQGRARGGRHREPRDSRPRAWPARRCTACSAAIPTGRITASPRASGGTASARPASCSRRTAIRTTAPHPRPTTRRRARLVSELDRLGLEVGLHASYTCLADERLLSGERAELARLLGGPIAGNRHHYLRLPWHDGHPGARPPRLRVRHDARLRGAARTRAPASRSRSGPGTSPPAARMRILELPLVLMDATLAEERYLGALARGGLGARSSACSTICTTWAAARACSGTTIASTASTGAAGTGSTSACSTASRRAAATPTRRAPLRPTGGTSDARPDRVVLLPARRRRRGAARAQALPPPAGARHRGRRACARRPEVERRRSRPGRRHPARDRPCTARATAARRTRRRPLRGWPPRTECAHSACGRRCSAAASCCPTPRSRGSPMRCAQAREPCASGRSTSCSRPRRPTRCT